MTQSSLGLAMFCWVLRIWVTKGVKPAGLKLELAFALFILANLISLPFSSNVLQSAEYLKRLLLIPIVYMMAEEVTDPRFMKSLIYVFVASLFLYSVLGIVSFIQNPALRVSNVHNSMTAGGITMISSLITFAWMARSRKWYWWIFWGAITLVNLTCLILTSTRGSWLGFMAGAVVVIWFTNKKLLLGLVLLIPMVYLVTPQQHLVRANHMFDPNWKSNRTRIMMWAVGEQIFLKHPIVGIGDVAMNNHMRHYAPPATLDLIEPMGHFHSNYVHIAVSLGLIGFLAFMFMLGSVLYRLFVKRRELKGPDTGLQYTWLLAATGIFVAFCVNGFFEWNYGDAEIATMIWFAVGLALTRPFIKRQEQLV